MFRTRILLVLLACSVPAAAAWAQPDDELPAIFQTRRFVVAEKDDPVARCLKQRFNAAYDAFDHRYKKVMAGAAFAYPVTYEMLGGMVDCALELKDFPERDVFLGRALAVLPTVGAFGEAQFESGKIGPEDIALDRFERLTVELRLVKAMQRKPAAK